MEPAATVVDVVHEERYWYPEEGGAVWLAGYQLIDRASGEFVARDSPLLAERGLRVCAVAGAGRHHAGALASDAAAPGARLSLRRDPANPHDRNAIAVETPAGDQVGWVPREIAAEIAPTIDAGSPWSAVALREQRRSPRDPRHGLTMLLAASADVELKTA